MVRILWPWNGLDHVGLEHNKKTLDFADVPPPDLPPGKEGEDLLVAAPEAGRYLLFSVFVRYSVRDSIS